MGTLFCVIHCTPEVYIYCSYYLLPTRVIVLQVVRTSFLAPRPCYFPLLPLVLTLYVEMIMYNLREVVALKSRLFVTGTGNHRQPLFTFTCTCNPWSIVLTLQVAGNVMY